MPTLRNVVITGHFQKLISEMFEDTEGAEVVVEDLFIWGESAKQHDSR